MITKNSLFIWCYVICIFTQTMIPWLIALLAILSFLARPLAFISTSGVIRSWRVHGEWALPLILILISTVNSGSNLVSISYFLNFISMYFLVVFAVSKIKVIDIAKILSAIMVVSLLGACFQFIYFFKANTALLSELSFIFSDRNYLGMYLAAGYIANLYLLMMDNSQKNFSRKLILIIVPLFMFALGSRSALLGLLCGICAFFYFLRRNHRLIIFFVIAIFIALVINIVLPTDFLVNLRMLNAESSTSDSDIIRFSLILISLDLFFQNPILGVGPNLFLVYSGQFLHDMALDLAAGIHLSDGLVTHNSFLQYFVELGVVLGAFVVWRILMILRLYFIFRSRPLLLKERQGLAFLFSSSFVFLISGNFLNLHSSIFFIFVVFGLERMIRRGGFKMKSYILVPVSIDGVSQQGKRKTGQVLT